MLATGCGGHRSFVTDVKPAVGGMRFVDRAAAPAGAPGIAPAAVVFLNTRHGFIATTGGGFEIPKTGWQPPFAAARVQETRDGGATWRTVWSGRHVALQQLVFAGHTALALGVRSDPRPGVASYPQTGFAIASSDGGEHWRVARAPRRNATLATAGSSVIAFGHGGLERFDAPAGRWRSLAAPPGLGTVVAFSSDRVGWAAGSCAGGEQLWRTDDGARSWSPVEGTCAQAYSALEADGRADAAVQAAPHLTNGRISQLFRRSVDGGLTWPAVAQTIPFPNVTTLHFTDARHAWGVEWINSQGFFDSGLIRTSDGGRTWSHAASFPAPPSAFAGTDDAWAVDGMNGVVWHTTDGAHTWQASVSPRFVSAGFVDEASPGRVVVATSLGTLASRDGRHWVAARTPPSWVGGLARIVQPTGGGEAILLVAGHRVPPPRRSFLGSAWFTSERDGIVADGNVSAGDTRALAWSTRDGGRTWQRVRLPPGVDPQFEAALGPNTLVVDGGDRVYVTADGGRHWSRFAEPLQECLVSRPERTVWVLCAGTLLRGADDGRTWTESHGGPEFASSLGAVSDTEAWVTAPTEKFGIDALWHTIDGGATWRRVAVGVDPSAAVAYRLPPYSLTP